MEFATNFRKHPRKPLVYDKIEQNVYVQELDKKTGERKLVSRETVNIYDKIQEYAEEVKIQNIMSRYNQSELTKNMIDDDQIIDLTNMPTNLLETITAIDNAKYLWERQSTAIKNKFNNDFKQFIASSQNGQLAQILNEELKQVVKLDNSIIPNNVVNNTTTTTQVQQSINQVQQPTNQVIENQMTIGGNTNV